ncbi:MAG: hypothetical protein IPH43_14395 [Xanthomonadales bacterium]|nr:hypothetical protein [Xanthomonadales bacterium]
MPAARSRCNRRWAGPSRQARTSSIRRIPRRLAGAIDFILDTAGTQTADGPDASLTLAKVGGTLRGKPLGGSADLHLQPGYIVNGTLDVQSGGSRLVVEGRGGTQTNAQIR